jgi:hypothetical protein
MFQLVTVFMMVRIMTVILMILTMYVTEQCVSVIEISNLWATEVWTHRQGIEHSVFLFDYTIPAVPYKRFVNKKVQAVTPNYTSNSDQIL